MNLYILDTDHVSLLQRGNAQVAQRIADHARHEIVVTIVTAEEQLRGRLRVIRRAESGTLLNGAYEGLLITIDYFRSVELLGFDLAAAEVYADLRSRKITIGTQDLRIAAIALSAGGILVTRNRHHFRQVPDLQIEDWST